MGMDPHSFARPDEIVIRHLNLDLKVDFDSKQISGKATVVIENKKGVGELYLDTNGLIIQGVRYGDDEARAQFSLGDPVRFLGQPLVIQIPPETRIVHIYYSTRETSAALQWLEPLQTFGGKFPFLYTQSQACLARSWVPCQDTPGVRHSYHAKVKVPLGLMAVMSAENVTRRSSTGVYEFNMPQTIPAYLLALAVGDIEFRPTGRRTGVYSEPSIVEKVAWEFAETEKMMEAAERLYGPYRWGRYDILVLPPSFPWGGMENPRITFATPTVLAGDRSLVSLVAHELAHSWSGNLVTNATWNDFWLNEGFTTYFDHRIMEQVYGRDYDDMLSVLSMQDLERETSRLGATSPDTHLKLDLAERDPEESSTQIPYEKGQFFLRTIERSVGREKWDQFLRGYFDEFAFRSLTTEDFLAYLKTNLIRGDQELEKKLQIDAWVYAPGIPSNIVEVHARALEKVEEGIAAYLKGRPLTELESGRWATQEWIHFLRKLPADLSDQQMAELQQTFHFSESRNSEILHEWVLQVIARKYQPAYSGIERLLSSNGRRKYVKSVFTELSKTPEGNEFARRIYQKTRPTYHAITWSIADKILGWQLE